ncbi:MAG: 2'-5' RNA ligase family protein [Candidatus Saccharibacteria bacterium]|nr:2'-5' RNA ligase family protein [Candidatus Saccharibacteria bacterium]
MRKMKKSQYLVLATILDTDYQSLIFFERWPIHLTVLPPFKTNNLPKLESAIEEIIADSRVKGGKKSIGAFVAFGKAEETAVRLIEDDDGSIKKLHQAFFNELRSSVVDKSWCGDNFCPHISIGRKEIPKKINFNNISLILVDAVSRHSEILHTFHF